MLDALCVLAPETPLGPAPSSRLLKVDGAQHYIFAPAAGIFEPAFTLGDEVQAGQFAGRIHDPRRLQAVPAEIFFEAGGLAICTRSGGHTYEVQSRMRILYDGSCLKNKTITTI